MSGKPFSQSCENNKAPILGVLKSILVDRQSVLEIGSGTGQHAVYFAAAMPHLSWQASDLIEYHVGINQWLEEAGLSNTRAPIVLDVLEYHWGRHKYDAVFTANTLHIMSLKAAMHLLQSVSRSLPENGLFVAYGPFNYGGAYTSESNQHFDQWLMRQNLQSGIRHFEALNEAAKEGGLKLYKDLPLPANNRVLAWQKSSVA